MSDVSLTMQEEMLLLVLRDEEGTPEFGTWSRQAVAAAAFAELLLRGCIAAEGDKAPVVRLVDGAPQRNEVLDYCIGRIRDQKKPQAPLFWIADFSHRPEVYSGVTEHLCRRGILRETERKVLFFFTQKTYPEVDSRPERDVLERIHNAIFSDDSELDPRTAVLIAIANQAGVLAVHFDKKRLRDRKERIDQIARGEITSRAMRDAAHAAMALQSAVLFTTVIMPTMMTD